MATTSLEAIRRITMEAREKGFDEVAAKLDKITKAQEGVVASSTSVTQSAGSTEQAFKKVERQLDSSVVAYQKYASQVKAVNDQLAQNPGMQKRATELIGLAETRLRKATGATEDFGEAAGPARHEWINLSRQLQDVGVSLQGGMPLLTVIAQQGSQISDAFISSKASMGDWVAAGVAGAGRFLAAWGPVIAVVTAAGAAAALAMHTLAQEREARIATTSGLGRLTAIGAGQVPQLAESARTPGMTLGDAREGVLEFIKAGATATTTLEGMALATRVAATTGSSLADAYKLLAGIIRDPAAAAKQLDDQFQILDSDTQKTIAQMQALGDRAGAARLVFEALTGALVSGRDATSLWNREWTEFIGIMEKAIERLGRFGPAVAAAMPKPGTLGEVAAGLDTRQALGRPAGQAVVDPGAAQASAAAVQAATAAVTAYEAEVVKAGRASNEMMTAVADSARAFELQKDVMMATTVEARAAATEAQALNQATGGLTATLAQEAAARQKGNDVRLQDAASTQQKIAAQQAELDMGQRLIAAATAQGSAGVALRAALQEELALLQAGSNATSDNSQKRIANAGAIAQQNAALQQANAIRQLENQLAMAPRIARETAKGISGMADLRVAREELAIMNEGNDVMSKQSQRRLDLARSVGKLEQAEASRTQSLHSQSEEEKFLDAQREANRRGYQREEDAKEAKYQADKAAHEQGLANMREFQAAADKYAAEEKARADAQKQLEGSLKGTLETLQLETSLVGASAGAHAEATTQLEYELKAREAETQGLYEAANAYREYGAKIAEASGDLARAKEAEQEAQQARQAAKQAAQQAAREDAAAAKAEGAGTFHVGKPLSEMGPFTSTAPLTWLDYQDRARKQSDKAAEVQKQVDEAEKAGQQRQLQVASSTIQDQIQALNDQKSAIGEQTSALDEQTSAMEENTSALEKETSKRREQLDKQIAKLEKALSPSKPDPYAERNPDYFYRFGSQAFKENDPNQALLAAAEAERDGLDKQLDAQKEAVEQQKQQVEQQKKAVELQQKAIDAQIKGYETQAKQLDRAGNLLSSGVELSAQEVSGLQAILAAIGALGDYTRLQQANVQTTLEAQQAAAKSGGDPASEFANTYEYAIEQIRRGKAYEPITPPTYGFQQGKKGFSGFFAGGGYIPPGSWGIAGESGPEVIRRKRAVAGPATVTPIGAGRPIVVNQTFVSQAGAKDLRASRGEIAQRSSSEMRRSLGAR